MRQPFRAIGIRPESCLYSLNDDAPWVLLDGMIVGKRFDPDPRQGSWDPQTIEASVVEQQTREVLNALAWWHTPHTLPRRVRITRRSPGRPLTALNLVRLLSPLESVIARWHGVERDDPRLAWKHRQEAGAWGVKIEWLR